MRRGVVSLVAASRKEAWKTEPTATWQMALASASKTWREGTVTNVGRAISRFNIFWQQILQHFLLPRCQETTRGDAPLASVMVTQKSASRHPGWLDPASPVTSPVVLKTG